MKSIGEGVREIRVRDASGGNRVVYVATFRSAVYVLHSFVKKARRTPAKDIDIAASRLNELKRRVDR